MFGKLTFIMCRNYLGSICLLVEKITISCWKFFFFLTLFENHKKLSHFTTLLWFFDNFSLFQFLVENSYNSDETFSRNFKLCTLLQETNFLYRYCITTWVWKMHPFYGFITVVERRKKWQKIVRENIDTRRF